MFRLFVYGDSMNGYRNHASLEKMGASFVNMYKVYGLRLYDLYLETEKSKTNFPIATKSKSSKDYVMGEVYQFHSDKALRDLDALQSVDHESEEGTVFKRINIADNTINPLYMYIGTNKIIKKVSSPYLIPYLLNRRWRPRDFLPTESS